jgi:type II restriction enzyme
VDVFIFKCNAEQYSSNTCRDPSIYVALGEIKGGIDPAGADEHWKTARTALSRIRTSFSSHDLSPKTFFIGAAIAERMAREIWEQLEAGTLNNAANLTDANQVASLCNWLVSL